MYTMHDFLLELVSCNIIPNPIGLRLGLLLFYISGVEP
jgi:hypothetical protein